MRIRPERSGATVTLAVTADGVDVTPAIITPIVTVIPETIPQIMTITTTRTAGTLSVAMHGFSNTRELSKAVFHFVASPGSMISNPDVTVDVSALFTAWYGGTESPTYGSSFTYPAVQSGWRGCTIASVAVTRVNSIGNSATETTK